MDNSITSLGLMSGTSIDGIDASIINSDGKTHLEVKANHFSQYKPDFRQKLRNYNKNYKFTVKLHPKMKYKNKLNLNSNIKINSKSIEVKNKKKPFKTLYFS